MPTDFHKLDEWLSALEQLSEAEPKTRFGGPWTGRFNVMRKSVNFKRFVWMKWVEERARLGHPAWCRELVLSGEDEDAPLTFEHNDRMYYIVPEINDCVACGVLYEYQRRFGQHAECSEDQIIFIQPHDYRAYKLKRVKDKLRGNT